MNPEARHRQAEEIRDLPRVFAVVTATVCGLFTAAAAAIAIYAAIITPALLEVPIYVGQQMVRTESKLSYLGVPVVFLFFLFLVPAFNAFRWEWFKRRAAASTSWTARHFGEALLPKNMKLLMFVSLGGWMLMSAFVFCWNVNRSLALVRW
jgi:hypothetical protein